MTDQRIGRASIALSALGSLCALLCLFCLAADRHGHWFGFWETLQFSAVGCFLAGFIVGFVGWYSWEGKVGLGLAITSPLWVVAVALLSG